MKFKLIRVLFQNKNKSLFRNKSIFDLIRYFFKLKLGEFSGEIYNFNETKEKISLNEDMLLATNKWLDKSIRKTLQKINLKNCIIFEEEKGFENVGLGFIFVPFIFGKAVSFTQKEAFVFFKTDQKKSYNLKINFVSIPKTKVYVKIENTVIDSFNINSLSYLQKMIQIEPNLIKEKISKISIIVEKCWSPSYVFNEIPNYPLGIGIEQIEIL